MVLDKDKENGSNGKNVAMKNMNLFFDLLSGNIIEDSSLGHPIGK